MYSLMTWVFVGRSDDEWAARVEAARRTDPTAGPFDDYLADISKDCFVGTVEQVVDRMHAYLDAGVERFVLNHELFDDPDHIELLGNEVLPKVGA